MAETQDSGNKMGNTGTGSIKDPENPLINRHLHFAAYAANTTIFTDTNGINTESYIRNGMYPTNTLISYGFYNNHKALDFSGNPENEILFKRPGVVYGSYGIYINKAKGKL